MSLTNTYDPALERESSARRDRDDCHQCDRGFAADVRAVVGLAYGRRS